MSGTCLNFVKVSKKFRRGCVWPVGIYDRSYNCSRIKKRADAGFRDLNRLDRAEILIR